MTLKEFMYAKNVNCSQVARAAKTSPQTISRIVKGVRKPSNRMAFKIAKALGARPRFSPSGVDFIPSKELP